MDMTQRDTGLTDAQARHLAEVLRPYLMRYDNNQTKMARAWEISQPHLSQLLSGKKARGAGVAVLIKIRKHTGRSLDDLLGLTPVPGADRDLEAKVEEMTIRAIQSLQGQAPVLALPAKPTKRPKPAKQS